MKRFFVFNVFIFVIAFNSFANWGEGGSISWEKISSNLYKITTKTAMHLRSPYAGVVVSYRNKKIPEITGSFVCDLVWAESEVPQTKCDLPNGYDYCKNSYCTQVYVNSGFFDINAIYFEGKSCALLNDSLQEWELTYSSFNFSDAIYNITFRGSRNIHVEALLINNNTIFENSSATSENWIFGKFCFNEPAYINFNFTDIDNDSLVFELVEPYSNAPIIYAAGLSHDKPVYTFPNNSGGFRLLKNGNILLNPDSVLINYLGFCLFSLKCTEYRNGKIIGWHTTEFCVLFLNDPFLCGNKKPTFESKSTKLPCGAKELEIKISTPIAVSSVSEDASDFRLFSEKGDGIPLESLEAKNITSTKKTSELKLRLNQPLMVNGDYVLISKKGRDKNTFIQKCGLEMQEFDSLKIKVSNCYANFNDYNQNAGNADYNTNESKAAETAYINHFKVFFLSDFKTYFAQLEFVSHIYIISVSGNVIANREINSNNTIYEMDVAPSATYIYKTTYKDGSFEIGRIIKQN